MISNLASYRIFLQPLLCPLTRYFFLVLYKHNFLARDSIYAIARYAIARLSVRPSVCHTGGSVKDG